MKAAGNTPEKEQRPLAITLIGWLIIVVGLVTIASMAVVLVMDFARLRESVVTAPLLSKINFAINTVGTFLHVICGIAMLKGRRLARIIWLCYLFTGWAVSCGITGLNGELLLSFSVFLALTFLLYRQSSNRFFALSSAPCRK